MTLKAIEILAICIRLYPNISMPRSLIRIYINVIRSLNLDFDSI